VCGKLCQSPADPLAFVVWQPTFDPWRSPLKEQMMIHKTQSPLPGHVRVVFELPSCIWADRIFVVGDFNHWNERATPFSQDRDGVWRAAVDLKVGSRAEFRYLIDGQWRTDYHADDHTYNSFGSENSVVRAEWTAELALADRLSSRVHEEARREVTFPVSQPIAMKVAKLPRRTTSTATRAAA
jgi:hypothetical protein